MPTVFLLLRFSSWNLETSQLLSILSLRAKTIFMKPYKIEFIPPDEWLGLGFWFIEEIFLRGSLTISASSVEQLRQVI